MILGSSLGLLAQSPPALSCSLPGDDALVLGQVLAVHVHQAVLVKDGAGQGQPTVDVNRLRPLGRLGGNTYCRVGSTFDLPRPDRVAAKR